MPSHHLLAHAIAPIADVVLATLVICSYWGDGMRRDGMGYDQDSLMKKL